MKRLTASIINDEKQKVSLKTGKIHGCLFSFLHLNTESENQSGQLVQINIQYLHCKRCNKTLCAKRHLCHLHKLILLLWWNVRRLPSVLKMHPAPFSTFCLHTLTVKDWTVRDFDNYVMEIPHLFLSVLVSISPVSTLSFSVLKRYRIKASNQLLLESSCLFLSLFDTLLFSRIHMSKTVSEDAGA